jgi:hypothetical protein
MTPNGLFLPVFGENLQKISKLMLAGKATKTPKFFKIFFVSENVTSSAVIPLAGQTLLCGTTSFSYLINNMHLSHIKHI